MGIVEGFVKVIVEEVKLWYEGFVVFKVLDFDDYVVDDE